MSSLTRTIARGIARKNGTISHRHGKTPNYGARKNRHPRQQELDKTNILARLNALFGRRRRAVPAADREDKP